MLVALAVGVPALFDPHATDVFDLPKLTALVVGAAALLALGSLRLLAGARHFGASRQDPPLHALRRPSAFGAAIAAVVLWEVISAANGAEPLVSVIGRDGSYSDTLVLVAAGGIVALVARDAVRPERVRSVLAALYLGGGGLAVLYGALQLHDRLARGARWDPVHWGHLLFPNVFSTFGNPDHFGGFLAILLPVGLGLLGTCTSRFERAAIASIGVAALVELLETAARGAWLATIVAMALLAADALFGHRRRASVRLLGAGVATLGVLGALAAGLAFGGARLLGPKFQHLVASGSASSIAIREDIWGVALRIGLHHPLLGTGPGTFQDVLPASEPSGLARAIGPRALVNGSHDLLLNHFAEQGAVGAVLLLVLLGVAFVTIWRIARGHRSDCPGAAAPHSDQQILAITVGAALAAYVVEASFDSQQVGLEFCFWLLVGLAGAMARSRDAEPTLAARPAHARRARPPSARRMAIALALAAASVGAFTWRATLPLRADQHLWAALSSPASNPSRQLAALSSAVALDPWDPLARADRGAVELAAGLAAGGRARTAARLLRAGVADFRAAAAIAPRDPHLLDSSARALLDAASRGALPREHAVREALALLHRAARTDPHDPQLAADLSVARSYSSSSSSVRRPTSRAARPGDHGALRITAPG